MKVCVVGTGYVGLVAGTCFAESGNDVICVDVDAKKIAALGRGEVPLYEPGLAELIGRNIAQARLRFQTDLAAAVRQSLICFIAVGTPEGADGEAETASVMEVARQISQAADGYCLIVTKSTVPVGTAARIEQLLGASMSERVDVVSNPEFLKEGAAVEDFQRPDRVIVGCRSQSARAIMEELYKPFVRTGNQILVMTPESAEMSKYAANAMLATRISLINEIANLCETVGSDIEDVRRAVGLDRRIGSAFLFPGVGYGGSCFPKDVKALIHMAEIQQVPPRVLRAVEQVNEAQKQVLFDKVIRHFGEHLNQHCFAVWGLSFKPRTDDMREAPAVTLIEALLTAGAHIQTHDPEALRQARQVFGNRVSYHDGAYDALRGVDGLLIVTEWGEFKQPNFDRMKALMRQPVIFDGRNLYEPQTMRRMEFTYYAIGRPRGRST